MIPLHHDPWFTFRFAETDSSPASTERLGVSFTLVDRDALANANDPVRAARRVPPRLQPDLALYRGWMLTPEQYRLLYEALAAKGLRLLNDPAAYRHCHYLPE